VFVLACNCSYACLSNPNRWPLATAPSETIALSSTRAKNNHSHTPFPNPKKKITYLILNHIPLQQLARRVPIRSLRNLRVENTSLVLDEIVSRRLGVDREVGGLAALAHLVTLLLHGPDIVGAAACLH